MQHGNDVTPIYLYTPAYHDVFFTRAHFLFIPNYMLGRELLMEMETLPPVVPLQIATITTRMTGTMTRDFDDQNDQHHEMTTGTGAVKKSYCHDIFPKDGSKLAPKLCGCCIYDTCTNKNGILNCQELADSSRTTPRNTKVHQRAGKHKFEWILKFFHLCHRIPGIFPEESTFKSIFYLFLLHWHHLHLLHAIVS